MSDRVIAALRKHIAKRRAFIQNRFPKHLNQTDYLGLCGMHQEIEEIGTLLEALVRQGDAPEPDEIDDTAVPAVDPRPQDRKSVNLPSTRIKTK